MQELYDASPATATVKKQVGTGNNEFCCSDSLIGRTVNNTPSSERVIRGGLTGLDLVKEWLGNNRSENLVCPGCGRKLRPNNIEARPHPDGWEVPGLEGRQWLSIRCSPLNCNRLISLEKLGIYNDDTFLNDAGVEVLR